MTRTPFAVFRQIRLAIQWYGNDYVFKRDGLDAYGEPTEPTTVETILGIYHANSREFVELINNEGAEVKSKINKGIVCTGSTQLNIQQRDFCIVADTTYYVTAVEPILYNGLTVGYEISLEEQVEGIQHET